MIKNLRYAIAALAMMTCGATYAQETFNFKDIYDNIEPSGTDKTVLYLMKDEAGAGVKTIGDVTLTFAAGDCSSQPAYQKYTGDTKKANGCIRLYGGKKNSGNLEGSTMTFAKAGGNIKSIKFTATPVEPGSAVIKPSTGEIVMEEGTRNYIWTGDANEVKFTICQRKDDQTDAVRFLEVDVNPTTTGITSVTTSTAKNGVRYNIAGQRVGNDFKGLVIENGQKKIIK